MSFALNARNSIAGQSCIDVARFFSRTCTDSGAVVLTLNASAGHVACGTLGGHSDAFTRNGAVCDARAARRMVLWPLWMVNGFASGKGKLARIVDAV